MQKALGVLETFGLLAAVTVADTMVKAANVELIGYELAKGSGMTAVKVQGDVGAVKAALASGEAIARDLGLYRGKNLIPRPAENLDMMIFNDRTEGYVPGGSIKDRPKGRKASVRKETEEAASKPSAEAVKPSEEPAKAKAEGQSEEKDLLRPLQRSEVHT